MRRTLARRVLSSAGAMTAACAAAMMLASTAHRGSPWAGVNAMATAAPGLREPRARFDRFATPLGLALLGGGLLLWATAYEAILVKTGRERSVMTGALAAIGAFAVDRFVLPRDVVRNFIRTLGPAGTFGKYAALGAVASF